MARLVTRAKHNPTVTADATNWTALMSFVAPTNQKLAVRLSIFGKGSGSDPSVQYEVRRASDLTGATTSALTKVPVNLLDTETPQATINKFTGQPSDVSATNGSVVTSATRKPNESVITDQFVVNGGETFTLWGKTTTTSCAVDLAATVEE